MKRRPKVLLICCLSWFLFISLIFAYLIFATDNFMSPLPYHHIKYVNICLLLAFIIFAILFLKSVEYFKRVNHRLANKHKINNDDFPKKEYAIRLTHYDNLTSLPNRVYFNEILNKTFSMAKRHQKTFAILFINLDNFQNINDIYSQKVGDLILKEIGHRLMTMVRAGDIIARLGGDEFMILLNDIINPKLASSVTEKILAACSEPFKYANKKIAVTASIGVAIYPNDGESLEELQKHADVAMFKAKQNGGNCYQYYQTEMDVEAHEYYKLDSMLKRAIQNQEFILYYQPQLSLESGVIKSVEALIRWQHPKLGLMNPDKFIPLAEETGLIMQIGEWALQEACRTLKNWQQEGYDDISVAVNISAKQFHHQDIATVIQNALNLYNLDPKYLEIEITETSIMINVEEAIKKLQKLKAMGIRISIDDFGTGYASINYLKKFPVNVLKIDQTFIKGIPNNQNDLAITKAIIELGHNIGLDIVAEGVENTEQIQFLAENSCDLIQGYFLSRPLPPNKIILQFNKKGLSTDTIVQSK